MADEDTPSESPNDKRHDDWKIYDVLCGIKKNDEFQENVEAEEKNTSHDLTTALRSEVAALEFQKDRLKSEVIDMKNQLKTRDQKMIHLQVECDQLHEQSIRQNSVISSLKKKIQDLEDKERELYATQGRQEIKNQTLIRENQYNEEKIKDMEKKIRSLEMELASQEQLKETARSQMQDLIRRLTVALGEELIDPNAYLSPEGIVHKTSEIVQEVSRLRNRSSNINETLNSVEMELRSCRENLDRVQMEKETLQRQCSSNLVEIEHLRKEKESLEMHLRVTERELNDMKDKLTISNKNLGNISTNYGQLEANISQIKDELKIKEDKYIRLQSDTRNLLESLAVMLSFSSRYVDTNESAIKERIREIINDNKDKSIQIESLKEKLNLENQQVNRHLMTEDQLQNRIHVVEDEKRLLESKISKLESELKTTEIAKENLKRDKNTFISFLERLARAMNMEEISQEIGIDLHTESLIVRAEQLTRLESDKLIDKTSVVYQLQRRLRTLREQLQRKELHLDLLRRKIALQEDSVKVKCLLQTDRDEALLKSKKLQKQVDKLQLQLADAKAQCNDLSAQLAEAADYKITCLERERKIDDLQKRLVDTELLRTRYNRKISVFKEQLRISNDNLIQERQLHDQSMQLLRDELNRVKDELNDVSRQLTQFQTFKANVAKILGCPSTLNDYDVINRLQKLVDAHHDFTLVSRRYDDPVLRLTTRSPTVGSRCTRTPDRSLRYEDSGYLDTHHDIIDDLDDNNL